MGPEHVLYGVIGGALVLYAVLGGADFGVGVWEFNLRFRMTREDRELSEHAMGPVWETNHVWLIFAIILMFSAFPIAFAAICRALWIPLLLALAGIVFRGSSFAFRHYAVDSEKQRVAWGILFAIASTFTPFFLGVSAGAIASGRLAVTESGEFTGNLLTGWVSFLSIYSGFFTVGLCAYLAAVYLTRDASREFGSELAAVWRRRALLTGIVVGAMAVGGLAVVGIDSPDLGRAMASKSWSLVAMSVAAGTFSLWALARNRFTASAVGAVLAVASIVAGWAVAQYPMLVPPVISIESAKAPDGVLRLFVWVILIGAAFLGPSLAYLFYVFKGGAD